jgi:Fe-Mn family superoxide dismutase
MNSSVHSRRSLIAGAGTLAATAAFAGGARAGAKIKPAPPPKMAKTPVAQIALPFADDALAPLISAQTIGLHYGKHHKIYADKVIAAIKGTPQESASLEDLISAASRSPAKSTLFNMAAQVWNHNFYWQSLSPKPQAPSGKLADAIARDFGSLEACKKALTDVAVGQFGSGWGWLVLDRGKLKAVSTSNADVPFLHGLIPLITVDVWEHAYYLDYQNRRADHVGAIVDKALNWEFAAKNFAG